MQRRVLLIGATGSFGSRLARLLAAMPDLTLVLAARSRGPLAALRTGLAGCAAALDSQIVDRRAPPGLGGFWMVIDAAGPFQGDDHALPLAAVRAGAHYIDLADGRDFVAGFPAAVGEAARAAGVVAVTGASSTPALSHAALAMLVDGWSRIDTVQIAISPGARAPRGLSVMEAILSYAGQELRAFRGGAWTTARGWSGMRRLYMPGIGFRLVSICDTPDLDLLPARFPIRHEALFLAGLELPLMQVGLAALSVPVRLGLVRSLRPLARPLLRVAGLLVPFGTDRGGMIVEATGCDAQGRPCRGRWALWAEADAGPNVPTAAAAALVRALMAGSPAIAPGARPCCGLMSCADVLAELRHLPIRTRIDAGWPADASLYRRLLGARFDELPASVRIVHAGLGTTSIQGGAIARAGPGLFARLARRVLRFPAGGRHDVEVTIAADASGERWTRRFGESAFSSRLEDAGRIGLFRERFGPLGFDFDLQPAASGVEWQLVGWRLGPLPLPRRLAPNIIARAEDAEGRYRFRVVVAHPWLGLLFAYRGLLDVQASGGSSAPFAGPKKTMISQSSSISVKVSDRGSRLALKAR